jgi:hypothetical protein
VNDAQIWTVIGAFFTVLIAGQALVLRVVRSENRALEERIERVAAQIRAEIAELRGELLTAITGIDTRLSHLERDR